MTEGVFKARPRKLKGSSKGIDKLNARRRRVLSKQIGKRDKEIKFEKGMLDTYGNTKLDRDRYQGKIDLKKKSKRKLKKKLATVPKTMSSNLGKKLAKGTGVLGLLSSAMAAPTIYEIYKGSTDDEVARSQGYKDSKEYKKQALKQIKNIPSALKDIFLEDPIGSTANLAWYANLPRALITEAIAPKEVASGTLDNYSPQQLKKLRKKAMLSPKVKRKKGGKVGRPKGVGCAIKGYGKAMKRGK